MLAISTLLSGCFGSDKPMFAPETAVKALEPGRYGLFEQYGDQIKPSEYMEVRLSGNVYDFVNEKGASNPVTFHPIAGGLVEFRLHGAVRPADADDVAASGPAQASSPVVASKPATGERTVGVSTITSAFAPSSARSAAASGRR